MEHCARVLGSKTFKFLVGPEKDEYNLHTALVSHHSKPLGVLANGQMREARAGFALLEDVDKDTFVRFGEYIYTGNYQPTEPSVVSNESSAQDADSADQLRYDSSVAMQPMSGTTTRDRLATTYPVGAGTLATHERRNPFQASRGASGKTLLRQLLQIDARKISSPGSGKKNSPNEDYSAVFLSHAQTYVFADRYDVQELKNLALQKLQRLLHWFILYPERTGEVSALLHYVYHNTPELGDKMDELRFLVVRYVVSKIDLIAQDELFANILYEGGPIAHDIIKLLVQRPEEPRSSYGYDEALR